MKNRLFIKVLHSKRVERLNSSHFVTKPYSCVVCFCCTGVVAVFALVGVACLLFGDFFYISKDSKQTDSPPDGKRQLSYIYTKNVNAALLSMCCHMHKFTGNSKKY